MSTRDSRLRTIGFWLLDRIWPTLEPAAGGPLDETEDTLPEIPPHADQAVLQCVYERLSAELSTEADRRRAVEAKLIAVGAVAPVSVTIIAALVTFLSSGRARDFTAASVILVTAAGSYASLQFLRALLAAIRGLSRMSYAASTASAILTVGQQGTAEYLRHASTDLANRLEQHREANNERVSQLGLAHVAIINAVAALIVVIVVLFVVTAWELLR